MNNSRSKSICSSKMFVYWYVGFLYALLAFLSRTCTGFSTSINFFQYPTHRIPPNDKCLPKKNVLHSISLQNEDEEYLSRYDALGNSTMSANTSVMGHIKSSKMTWDHIGLMNHEQIGILLRMIIIRILVRIYKFR